MGKSAVPSHHYVDREGSPVHDWVCTLTNTLYNTKVQYFSTIIHPKWSSYLCTLLGTLLYLLLARVSRCSFVLQNFLQAIRIIWSRRSPYTLRKPKLKPKLIIFQLKHFYSVLTSLMCEVTHWSRQLKISSALNPKKKWSKYKVLWDRVVFFCFCVALY